MQHQLQHQTTAVVSTPPSTRGEAPPKQVALAMERLSHAARLITDIRLRADRLIKALFVAVEPHKRSKPLDLFIKEDSSMRRRLQELRSIATTSEFQNEEPEACRGGCRCWSSELKC